MLAIRCSRARRRADELRTAGLRRLQELQRMEQEREARLLESRRAGLSFLVARGAGLRGKSSSSCWRKGRGAPLLAQKAGGFEAFRLTISREI